MSINLGSCNVFGINSDVFFHKGSLIAEQEMQSLVECPIN